jgi:predicted RND superfamily exporter protein
VGLVVASGWLATRIDVDTSMKREFSPRDPVRVGDAQVNASFAGTNTLILLVEGTSEGSLEEPAVMRAISGIERRLEAEPGVGKAVSYVDFLAKMHREMTADRPDGSELPSTKALAAQYLFLYGMSGGADDFDAMLDPTHRIAKVRVLVHEDDTMYGNRLIALAQDEVRRTFPPGYRVRYTGTLASSAAATEVMVEGKIRNILQIALITFLVASLLLRSWTGGILVATPLALTVAVNFGVMGLLGIPLDMITAAIAAMAVGIGADYAMYFLFRLREELSGGASLEDATERALMTSGKAVFFVSSAIAVGYATLCLSGFRVHVQLGALVALAMLVSSGSALFLLPAIIGRYRPAFLGRPAGAPATAVPVTPAARAR